MAALVAGALAEAPAEHLSLSGQGVRDVTRIAAGDPRLWEQILTANAVALADLLREVRDRPRRGARRPRQSGSREALGEVLGRGVAGTASIPGKHGGPPVPCRAVSSSACPTTRASWRGCSPTSGDIGVNVEDVRIDHDPGRPVGLVELTVAEDAAAHLRTSLEERGWSVHG